MIRLPVFFSVERLLNPPTHTHTQENTVKLESYAYFIFFVMCYWLLNTYWIHITSLEYEQTIIVFSVSVVTDSVWVSVPWLFIHPIYSFTLHNTYSMWHDISQLSLVWYQFDWLEYKIKWQITTDVRCWDYQVHAAQQTIQTISICFKTVYKGWLNRERRLISKVDQETSILDPPESFHVIAWR